jgi:RNA polymerase sigma factor (sigma-70 family)
VFWTFPILLSIQRFAFLVISCHNLKRDTRAIRTPFSGFFVNKPPNTQILIGRIQEGDSDAKDELCEHYLNRVYSAVRLRLGAGLRAKLQSCDIVQDALLDVVNGAETFECRSEGRFLNYVNRVIENRIRDEADKWNAQKRDVKREIAIDGVRSPDNSSPMQLAEVRYAATPSMVAVRHEELSTLEKAMDLLGEQSEEYRELVIAVQLEGRTYVELAADLGKSADAIRMQCNRAQAELAKIYKTLEDEN